MGYIRIIILVMSRPLKQIADDKGMNALNVLYKVVLASFAHVNKHASRLTSCSFILCRHSLYTHISV